MWIVCVCLSECWLDYITCILYVFFYYTAFEHFHFFMCVCSVHLAMWMAKPPAQLWLIIVMETSPTRSSLRCLSTDFCVLVCVSCGARRCIPYLENLHHISVWQLMSSFCLCMWSFLRYAMYVYMTAYAKRNCIAPTNTKICKRMWDRTPHAHSTCCWRNVVVFNTFTKLKLSKRWRSDEAKTSHVRRS